MRNRGKFALLFAAVVLAATALWAATPMTTLKIVVKTQTGRPIDRAEVIIQWNANAKHPRSSFGKNVNTKFEMRSNQEGQATMPPIPQGNIRVQVNAKGYQTFGNVFVVDEEEKTIEIKLNPPQQQYTSH
ncbi:MAG: carboxypeptidase-like regulatory domain-containing protein [Bryobacteraceae bacterium]|jgi:hypothetical protein